MPQIEMSIEQVADLREALSFLAKSMALDPSLKEKSVLGTEDVQELLAALDDQMSDVDLIKAIVLSS